MTTPGKHAPNATIHGDPNIPDGTEAEVIGAYGLWDGFTASMVRWESPQGTCIYPVDDRFILYRETP